MNSFSFSTKFLRKTVTIGALVVTALVGLAAYNIAQATNISISSVQDCDSNAVMYCGAGSVSQIQNKYANGVSGHNSASSIQHIYSYFGISGGDVSSLGQYVVAGDVYKNGNVMVDGEVVATNVWTAGRNNISGSTKVTYAGTTFYKRHPNVSFVSSPLKAYVVMKNGVFQFAILASCGNPVIGTPRHPNYSLEKQVRSDSTGFQKSVSVSQGSHVQFRITVKGTGEISAYNVRVQDQLPGFLTSGNNVLGGTGVVIGRLRPGQTVTYTIDATVGNDNVHICRNLTNTAHITSPGLSGITSSATVTETCVPYPPKPTPTPTCTPTPPISQY